MLSSLIRIIRSVDLLHRIGALLIVTLPYSMIDDESRTAAFYVHLAYLMYAVAMADGNLPKQEKMQIKELVEEHWAMPLQDTESEEVIYKTLRELIAGEVKSEGAYQDFSAFYDENPELFPEDVRSQIIRTADKIATATNMRNKSELVLLSRLHILLRGKQA